MCTHKLSLHRKKKIFLLEKKVKKKAPNKTKKIHVFETITPLLIVSILLCVRANNYSFMEVHP